MPNSESLQLPESIGKRVDPAYSQTLHTRLKELLHTQNNSFPGSQPVSFESKHLQDIEREDYFVCEKSDGVRYLLFFLHSSKGPASFLFDRNKYWYYVPNLLFPVRGRENEYLKDTIMDGELVLDIDQHKKTWRYLIFDLMVVNGSTIIQRSFSTRLGMLQQDVIQPFNARMRTVANDPALLPPFTVELKKMERSYGLHLVFEQIPKLKHKSDGIIWTPVKYPYTSGTCEKLLKWKPPELNTVDFRIAARWSKEHKPIYSVEVLSNGVTYKFYDHFQPEPALATQWKNQLPDGRIAEFRYDSECEVTIVEQGYAPTIRKGGWRFVRFRDDKSTANDEGVVKKILSSIQDGVTKEQLLLCMDRVRAAWKAREKGLPMPPLQTKSLSLTTITPTTPALSTPNSTTTSYFRDHATKDDSTSRSNSISEENMKRKSSVSSIHTPIKEEEEDVERKKLKADDTEEKRVVEKVVERKKSKTADDIEQKKLTVVEPIKEPVSLVEEAPKPVNTSPPMRKLSFVSEPVLKKEPDPPPPPKMRKNVSKRTPLKQEKIKSPIQTSSTDQRNRRSKSIPQPKETLMIKKLKPSSSTHIHNLLTTSVEPTPHSPSRAYNFSTILQSNDAPPPPIHQQQHIHAQQQQLHAQQQQLQQQQQQHAIQQQQGPVQFINFHAEARQPQVNNHVMIIRSESHTQPPPPRVWKNNVKYEPSQPSYTPQQDPYYDHRANDMYPSTSYGFRPHEQQPQPPPPQQKRKNSQKAKLDFILN